MSPFNFIPTQELSQAPWGSPSSVLLSLPAFSCPDPSDGLRTISRDPDFCHPLGESLANPTQGKDFLVVCMVSGLEQKTGGAEETPIQYAYHEGPVQSKIAEEHPAWIGPTPAWIWYLPLTLNYLPAASKPPF